MAGGDCLLADGRGGGGGIAGGALENRRAVAVYGAPAGVAGVGNHCRRAHGQRPSDTADAGPFCRLRGLFLSWSVPAWSSEELGALLDRYFGRVLFCAAFGFSTTFWRVGGIAPVLLSLQPRSQVGCAGLAQKNVEQPHFW